MKRWRRWEDWVALAAGGYTALSPLWTATNDAATTTMVVLGVIIVGASVWSLAVPHDRVSELGLVILGVLLFAAPWAMQFTELDAMALTAWTAGAVTFVMALLAGPGVDRLWHHAPGH